MATTIWAWAWRIPWSAIRAGARQLELTINGIGERAANAALEEVAVVLHVRQTTLGVKTNIHLDKLYATSRLLTGDYWCRCGAQ